MRVIIVRPGLAVLPIGRAGTDVVRCVFPIDSWVQKFGSSGEFILLCKRPNGASAYPVPVSTDGHNLIWDVSQTDTAIWGRGEVELQYHFGGHIAKSEVWRTETVKSIGAAGDPPDAEQNWIDKLYAHIDAVGVPAGGSSGQILAKKSATDRDTCWKDDAQPLTNSEIEILLFKEL